MQETSPDNARSCLAVGGASCDELAHCVMEQDDPTMTSQPGDPTAETQHNGPSANSLTCDDYQQLQGWLARYSRG